jgi:hypothetical protein
LQRKQAGKGMKISTGIFLRMSLVVFAVLALLVAVWFVLLPSQITYYTQPGPNVNASLGLLVITVLFVSIGAWIRFRDKKVKDWEKTLLLLSLASGLLMALGLALFVSIAIYPEWDFVARDYPTLVNNLHSTYYYMLIIASILFGAILGFTLVPRRRSIIEWIENV